MTKYLIAGGVIVLLLAGFAYSQGRGAAPSAQSFSHSHGMVVDPQNAGRLYIATHEGLYLLENEQTLSRIGETHDDLMGFTAHPSQGGVFFSSGHPARGGNIGFQKTTDGGMAWEKISDGISGPVDFHSMTVSRVNPDIVYGYFRGLQRSQDGGRQWEMTKGSISPISLSTDTRRENVVYAATGNGVQVSEDKGDSWKSLSAELEGGAVTVFTIAPDASYALAFSQKLGGLGKSTDGGVTWQRVSESFGGETVLYIAYAPSVVYALTDENNIYKSADGGALWMKVR